MVTLVPYIREKFMKAPIMLPLKIVVLKKLLKLNDPPVMKEPEKFDHNPFDPFMVDPNMVELNMDTLNIKLKLYTPPKMVELVTLVPYIVLMLR